MKVDRVLRVLFALLILFVFIISIAALLFVTESALNVWDRLAQGPRWLLFAYMGALSALSLLTVWITWRLVVKRKLPTNAAAKPVIDREEIERRLKDAESVGMAANEARAEMQELARRQASGAIHLCFFGEISTGKSSLVKALIPDANVTIDVAGGSTMEICHYRWRANDSTEILLTDVPGTGGVAGGLDKVAEEEARRSHGVVFVCDSDLDRREAAALAALLKIDKPLVLVLNKADRYSIAEQATILQRLLERIDELGGKPARGRVVAVTAGGDTEVLQPGEEGDEQRVVRRRESNVGVLVVAINQLLSGSRESLDDARDRAVFALAADKLEAAEAAYQQQRAEQIIRRSTRKAVLGALAAVSPGTDVLIQGYIGTAMTRDLCSLFGAAPRDLDIEEFLNLSQSRVGKVLPLSLAVAGNGLKAFPGIGTVAGGLVHAVAYGLIFDALGRSLVSTLEKQGGLEPLTAARAFEEELSEHIEAGVKRIAGMAVDAKAHEQD
jgi:GTP-binding protein EngB required for normal cell division